MKTFLSHLRNVWNFARMNPDTLMRASLSSKERGHEHVGTLPGALVRFLERMDLTHAHVLEIVTPEKHSLRWFLHLVEIGEVRSYRYAPAPALDGKNYPNTWWNDIIAESEANGDTYDIVVVSNGTIQDLCNAMKVCDSYGLIIWNGGSFYSEAIDHAIEDGCGVIRFESDYINLDKTVDKAAVFFRKINIFQ